jgi:hypothetical protein
MDANWASALDTAKQQTAALVAETEKHLSRESAERTQSISAQLAQIESAQRAYQARLAQVEGQLANAQQEVVALRRNYSKELAELHQQQTEARHEIALFNSALATRQVAFEIQKDQKQEIVPGVTLHLTSTNVHFQRFDGWIEPSLNGARLWIRDQGIQQPFVFYPSQQDDAFELVVTGVSARGAVGYILIPATNGAINQADVGKLDAPTPVTLVPTSLSGMEDR